PPVPSDSTRGAEPPEVRAKFSATRVAKGKTVDEPAAQMPARAFWLPGAPPPSLSPQAARATSAAAQAVSFRERIMAGPFQVVSMRGFRAAECDGPTRPL